MNENYKAQYFEHLRLHLWYSGSDFSFHKGKTNKEKAELHKKLSAEAYDKFLLEKNFNNQ